MDSKPSKFMMKCNCALHIYKTKFQKCLCFTASSMEARRTTMKPYMQNCGVHLFDVHDGHILILLIIIYNIKLHTTVKKNNYFYTVPTQYNVLICVGYSM